MLKITPNSMITIRVIPNSSRYITEIWCSPQLLKMYRFILHQLIYTPIYYFLSNVVLQKFEMVN